MVQLGPVSSVCVMTQPWLSTVREYRCLFWADIDGSGPLFSGRDEKNSLSRSKAVCVYLSPRLSDDLALGGFTAAGRDLSQSGQSTIPQDPSASHWEWLINQEVIQ